MRSFKLRVIPVLCVVSASAAFLWAGPAHASSLLGSSQEFAVQGASTVTNATADTTQIHGDVGVFPGSAITGLTDVINVNGGSIHVQDTLADNAQTVAAAAYAALVATPMTQNLTGFTLGTGAHTTLTPGTYHFDTSAQLNGTLTLDFAGHESESFVFQIGSTLTTASSSFVSVINGNAQSTVYWQVGSSATLGSSSTFAGNVLANASVGLDPGAQILSGRAIALNGAVTLSGDNHISNNSVAQNFGATDPRFFTDAGSLGFSGGFAAPVPEPSLALLFGTGVVSLMFLHCRRRTMLSDDAC